MALPYAIVIGASSGGVSALLELVSALPADLPAVVGVVLHVGAQPSVLPELLTARGPLRAIHPRDQEPLLPGVIYVAPPDHHMLFTPRCVELMRGPPENHARPSVDPLFRSAAVHWRDHAIGVVLTGDLDDGTAGLAAIKACGGTAIVQDPGSAFQPSMPASALANVAVDHCLPLGAIAALLVRQVAHPGSIAHLVPERLLREKAIVEGTDPIENLAAVEHAMWSSVRSLKERELLLRRLAAVSRATGDEHQAHAGEAEAQRLATQIKTMIQLIEGELASA